MGDAACVADDGYARHGVGESHDIQGWAILLINTINNSWVDRDSHKNSWKPTEHGITSYTHC